MHKVTLPFTPNFKFLSGGDSRGDPERGSGSRQRAWHTCSWRSSKSVTPDEDTGSEGWYLPKGNSQQAAEGLDLMQCKGSDLGFTWKSQSHNFLSQHSPPPKGPYWLLLSFHSPKIHTSVVWNRITFLNCGLAWNLTVKESWIRL